VLFTLIDSQTKIIAYHHYYLFELILFASKKALRTALLNGNIVDFTNAAKKCCKYCLLSNPGYN
jgi:hypothetical protein